MSTFAYTLCATNYVSQVMVDALLVHSKSSNCQEDVDKFLFSLGKMTGGTADPPPTTTDDDVVSSHLELPATVRSVLSRVNRDDTITSQESNILALYLWL